MITASLDDLLLYLGLAPVFLLFVVLPAALIVQEAQRARLMRRRRKRAAARRGYVPLNGRRQP